MSTKPIFVATHPRACSTAFERVFMTRRDILKCVHEPFGDAYYYGPERLAERYEDNAEARKKSGFEKSTYQTIFDRINQDNTEGKRLLIKDMAQYFIPPNNAPPTIAPSLLSPSSTTSSSTTTTTQHDNAIATRATTSTTGPPNPTVVPTALLAQFDFAFLIRHPRNSIPSYYRCTIPPLDEKTGFYNFRPDEAGYLELRALFDYLRQVGYVGPNVARDVVAADGAQRKREANGTKPRGMDILVIDADDLLDAPAEIIRTFCAAVGIDYSDDMLTWDDESQAHAQAAFEKWNGFHEDAIHSTDLKPRQNKNHKSKTDDDYYADWLQKYGREGAELIKRTVAENVEHYEYLRQFAIRLSP